MKKLRPVLAAVGVALLSGCFTHRVSTPEDERIWLDAQITLRDILRPCSDKSK